MIGELEQSYWLRDPRTCYRNSTRQEVGCVVWLLLLGVCSAQELHKFSAAAFPGEGRSLPGAACRVLRVFLALPHWVPLSSWVRYCWVSHTVHCVKIVFFQGFAYSEHQLQWMFFFFLGESIKDLLLLACSCFIHLQYILLTHFLCKTVSVSSMSFYRSFPMPLPFFWSLSILTTLIYITEERCLLFVKAARVFLLCSWFFF